MPRKLPWSAETSAAQAPAKRNAGSRITSAAKKERVTSDSDANDAAESPSAAPMRSGDDKFMMVVEDLEMIARLFAKPLLLASGQALPKREEMEPFVPVLERLINAPPVTVPKLIRREPCAKKSRPHVKAEPAVQEHLAPPLATEVPVPSSGPPKLSSPKSALSFLNEVTMPVKREHSPEPPRQPAAWPKRSQTGNAEPRLTSFMDLLGGDPSSARLPRNDNKATEQIKVKEEPQPKKLKSAKELYGFS